jgi:MFS family permease
VTQGNEESAGESAASATTAPGRAPVTESSPWAPLRQRAFRWLWVGVLISYVGTWMQTVGAQWLVVHGPNAATVVALVQAATTLPIMLLALPGGVLADSFDRRWLLFTVQAYFFVVGTLLVGLTLAGQMPPVLLLAFTFALGMGAAVQLPTWQAVIPELVSRTQLRAATRLEMVGVNFARSVGPALAGLVIARSGVPAVFALNALSVVFLAIALLFWHRGQSGSEIGRERFVPALRAGGRYVWHEPVVRRILLRTTLFIAPGMALWALLPLVATQRLDLGADGYGALFAALGIGAILGALVLGRVRTRLSTNAMLGAAGVLYAAGLATIVLAPNFAVALVILVFAGLAWTAAISTLNGELALFLPSWVRARGVAVYLVVFTGSQTAGALVWGLLAEGLGLQTTFFLAAAVLLAGVVAGVVWSMPEIAHLDRRPAVYWGEPRVAFDPEPDAGPVLVTVEYIVTPARETDFLEAMSHLRESRLRSGGTSWELYRDGERPDRFVEIFSVPSWEEHLRQHEGRLTGTDQEIEEAVLAFSDPPARAEHLLPP